MKKLILFFITTLLFSQKVEAQVPVQDSLALVAFYDATDGANWTNKTNWLNGPVSTWSGVTIVNNRVYTLSLFNNNLNGNIPPEIGMLAHMKFLQLSYNQLSGEIPPEISQLDSLQQFDIRSNQLSGSIPNGIANLKDLRFIFLDDNKLTGSIPTEIGQMISLTQLTLRNNKLTGNIPATIWQSNLTSISLGNNQLTGTIPLEIGQLTNLTYLGLNNNLLTGDLPQEIGLLTKLESLELNNNQLSGNIPPAITQWQQLFILELKNNQFSNLPDLSSMPYAKPSVENNRFEFDDLEPNINILTSYSPQDSIGIAQNKFVNLGEQIVLNITTGGTANTYKWFKDQIEIIGQTDSKLTISNAALSDAGYYTVKVNNSIINGLSLYTRPTKIAVDNSNLVADSLALVELYNSTGGPNWTNKTNWLNGPVSTWNGVTVIGGRVGYLDLSGNNLIGTIPTEIGQLTNLALLSLANNSLNGPLPASIGNLINLYNLNLSDNQLSGNLPTELGSLTQINDVYLNGNQFTGNIPSVIAQWPLLIVLELKDNKFSNLPDFSGSPILSVFSVENNKFEFDDLEPNISVLDSYSPQDSIGVFQEKIVNLGEELTITISTGGTQNTYKWFKDGTEVLGQTSARINIPLVSNSDAGVYRVDVKNTIVENLTLYSRAINVNIENLALKADSLALVEIYNSLDGANWTNNTNWLSGDVSTWYGVTMDYGRVTELKLSGNGLVGIMPSDIGQLTSLIVLSLPLNEIYFDPIYLDNLTELEVLNGSGFRFLVSFIQSWGSFVKLKEMRVFLMISAGFNQEVNLEKVSSQDFDSVGVNLIPPEIGNLVNLEELNLSGNNIGGELTSEIGKLTKLNSLNLSNNKFTGEIPKEIGKAKDMKNVNLNNNSFSGNINQLWGDWFIIQDGRAIGDNLVAIEAANNQFTGTIPPEIGNLTKLKKLDLSFNDLNTIGSNNLEKTSSTSEIPPEIGNISTLEILKLNNNRLEGVLPSTIGNLTKLTKLDIGSNNMTGNLPEEIGDLRSLDTLNIGNNNFTGELPLSMTNLTNLAVFNMDSTQLGVPNDSSFQNWFSNISEVVTKVEELKSKSGTIPNEFALEQNYPNPFNPTTTIQYAIPNVASGFSLSNVQLKVYDLLGREVATLVNEVKSPGTYEVKFDASQFTSGVYFYRLSAGDFTEIKKMLLIK